MNKSIRITTAARLRVAQHERKMKSAPRAAQTQPLQARRRRRQAWSHESLVEPSARACVCLADVGGEPCCCFEGEGRAGPWSGWGGWRIFVR